MTMRRAPGFAATALLTLALGIGTTTAVFTIVQGVLLRPLPYPHPDQLVRVWEEHPGGVSPAGNRWLSRPTYAIWREQTRTLDAIGGYSILDARLGEGAHGFKTFGARISPAILGTLGGAPTVGRFFADADDIDGASPIVIISDRLWHERHGASPAVVGASLTIDGVAHTIVGVAPAGFEFPDPRVRFWVPLVIPRSATATAGAVAFTAVGRLKPGVSLAQAEAEGTTIARAAPRHRLTEFFFGTGGPVVVHVRGLVDDMTAPARPALSVLAVAVALVLVIACANVTNLLLSRGMTRQRELAIRGAVGGSRARILRQLLTESAVFAIAGGVLGLAVAWSLVDLLPAFAPPRLPRLESVALDRSVVSFWVLATILTSLAAGPAPAIRGSRVDLADALAGADRSSSHGFRGTRTRRLRDGLLIVEAAFAVMLIVGASLLARSFVRLVGVDNGYTAERVLVATMELPERTTEGRTDEVIDAALARLRSSPGVAAAGAGAMIPLMARTAIVGFTVPQTVSGGKPRQGRALVYWVTPGYAEALGLRLRDGRFFQDGDARAGNSGDRQSGVRPAASLRSRCRRAPHPRPGRAGSEDHRRDLGVVGNVLKDGNHQRPTPELYFIHGSHGQRISGQVHVVIRASGNPTALAPQVRSLLPQVAPEAIVDRIEPLTVNVAASLDAPRFATSVFGSFALVAMALAAIGLYGVLSYSVSQRLRELAIRSALGAQRADLVRLVVREGLMVTFAGIALGVLGASLFTRLM